MAPVFEDRLPASMSVALEMVDLEMKKIEDMKCSDSGSTASDCDGSEACSCQTMSDANDDHEEVEENEVLRSRALTGCTLGDWWAEDAPSSTRISTVLTEYCPAT